MKKKIENLKKIIAENKELSSYKSKVDENWNKDQFTNFVNKILGEFNHLKDKEDRPTFYTDLQLLLNKYSKNDPYS